MWRIIKKICRRLKRLGGPPYTIIDSKLEGHNSFGANTTLVRSEVGLYTYMGAHCNFSDCFIGRFCCIGNNVKVVAAQHPINFISVHPFFYQRRYGNVEKNLFKDYKTLKYSILPPDYSDDRVENGRDGTFESKVLRAHIGHDVWIGDNVLIRGGVRIGSGAVIGMGAVVTKDVPPYAIVSGVPARVTKYRFEKEFINELLRIKWWESTEYELGQLAPISNEPMQFVEELSKF